MLDIWSFFIEALPYSIIILCSINFYSNSLALLSSLSSKHLANIATYVNKGLLVSMKTLGKAYLLIFWFLLWISESFISKKFELIPLTFVKIFSVKGSSKNFRTHSSADLFPFNYSELIRSQSFWCYDIPSIRLISNLKRNKMASSKGDDICTISLIKLISLSVK